MNKYIHAPIEFEGGNIPLVDELNKQGFRKDQLSEEDYYIKYGRINKKLKEQIEKDLINKFGEEKSDLLEYVNFDVTSDSILISSFYAFTTELSLIRLFCFVFWKFIFVKETAL